MCSQVEDKAIWQAICEHMSTGGRLREDAEEEYKEEHPDLCKRICSRAMQSACVRAYAYTRESSRFGYPTRTKRRFNVIATLIYCFPRETPLLRSFAHQKSSFSSFIPSCIAFKSRNHPHNSARSELGGAPSEVKLLLRLAAILGGRSIRK